MPSPNQTEKQTSRLFFSLLKLEPEDEEESFFTIILSGIDLKHGLDAISLLPCEDIHITRENLPFYIVADDKSRQFHLNYFQEKGLYSIDDRFEYSFIDESIFRKFVNNPTSISQIFSGMNV